MQDRSKDAGGEAWREPGFLGALVVAGTFIAGLIASALWSATIARSIAETDLVDRGMHNLDRGACQEELSSLMSQYRLDPRVLWVWVEESLPGDIPLSMPTLTTSVSREAPRPYAFRPDAAVDPAAACAFRLNSLHTLSLGDVTRRFLHPRPQSLSSGAGQMGGGPLVTVTGP